MIESGAINGVHAEVTLLDYKRSVTRGLLAVTKESAEKKRGRPRKKSFVEETRSEPSQESLQYLWLCSLFGGRRPQATRILVGEGLVQMVGGHEEEGSQAV